MIRYKAFLLGLVSVLYSHGTLGFLLPSRPAATSPSSLPRHIQRSPVTTAVQGSAESWFEGFKASQEGSTNPVLITLPDAQSIAQVLSEVFSQVLIAEKEGVPRLLRFPKAERLYDASTMARLVDHLDLCKDSCEVLGVSQNTVGMGPGSPPDSSSFAPMPSIFIKPMQTAGYDFEPDPFWDDDDVETSSSAAMGFGEDDGGDDGGYDGDENEALYDVPKEDEAILQGMKSWVGAVIADLGVCPFTVDAERAGLPQGGIRYEISRESSPEAIYSKYWQEVSLLSGGGNLPSERELSTTLLITPHFGLKNREYFESFSNTLTQPLEALQLEEDIQLVFFHPEWVFRDGADRMGSDSAANFARRSPWPMINILRTPQVRKAQKAIPTGLVYRQNEVTLDRIGFDKLQGWLEARDWGEVKNNYRVDRKTVPILSTAQDLLLGKTVTPMTATEGDDQAIAQNHITVEPSPVMEETQKPEELEEEEDDSVWDKPFDSRSMIEVEEEEDVWGGSTPKQERSRDEVIQDCVEIIKIFRKRINQQGALTPQEVKKLETLVKGVIQ